MSKCLECKFWFFEESLPDGRGDIGVCQRYPPVYNGGQGCRKDASGDWDQPMTFSVDWCGEFKAKL